MGDLAVGGPYSIALESVEYAGQTVTDVFLSLGETFEFNLALGDASIEEVVVTASAVETVQVAVGPSSTFSFDDLQNLRLQAATRLISPFLEMLVQGRW